MIEGVLLKGYGGFYYVYAEDRVWECSLRGRFRIKDQDFLPGDRVRILPEGNNKARIEGAEPRLNSLTRPSIANVDQALLVFALTSPKPDLNLLDRLLIQVTCSEIEPLIIFTKLDKYLTEAPPDDSLAKSSIPDIYRRIGYTVFEVSNKTGIGITELRKCLEEKISVLAGPSGAGKSSLFNALSDGKQLKTGEISQKSQRGRHTTRHVELMVCAGGLVADTPGFSSLFLPKMKREDLATYFPEFDEHRNHCRFSSCLHDKEPDCAIKAAQENGEISGTRYDHYRIFLQEVIAAERRY
ncbi:ribosome small subunit-dependent GTPase A [Desulfosporosinus acidiphilus SJ4]|uniref:Small ribosomal subunit biogenesis GTPase RsgA n=1 Tax=Desulfosporosinus acidiphilus (strain DSM 22704 / JCM 16185 / SJ4) TaxID=646529 RepID=I4D9T4_DESAJ|nr:ribosome small subunit-dependent GTPase A [Desulfosporosinus acidiphilus]AFM42558.1 ribosome small subunit-dependent GTPase A [Desulfosporosinus acidiphilus SJ4]